MGEAMGLEPRGQGFRHKRLQHPFLLGYMVVNSYDPLLGPLSSETTRSLAALKKAGHPD